MSSRRRWFRIAAVFAPLVFVLILEVILRLAGYGYSTHFFRALKIGGEDFLVQNDQFGLRFFPPEVLRQPPPLRMRAHKAAGACRIFILGESAAMGDPEPAFGAGRYLQALLEQRYPEQRFEVVNVSMTAINSHVLLPIARDCAGQSGDLWILYMGNNEMVGPFGAATVFGAQAPPLALTRLSLLLQQTRVGQLACALGGRVRSNRRTTASWGGMQMFLQNRVGPKDPRRGRVYDNFTRNLRKIVQLGLNSGAGVVLSTVAVNLSDCPPFASSPPPAGLATLFQQELEEAEAALAQGRIGDAIKLLERAVQSAPDSAEAHYRLGECLARAGKPASDQFQLACDLDALPFRADSVINHQITTVGRLWPGRRLVLCDAASALETHSASRAPGAESFYEHVHLNFDGNYRLARAWADSVAALLPARGTVNSNWASQASCEQRLGLTDWNRSDVVSEELRRMRQPPLSEQANNEARLQVLSAWQSRLRSQMNSAATAQARQVYLDAVRYAPEDFLLEEEFADFLQETGAYEQAQAAWQRVLQLIPHDHLAYYQLGRLAHTAGREQEAASWFEQCLAIRSNFSLAWIELGKVQAARGELEIALKHFARASELRPEDPQAWYWAGVELAKAGRREEAIERYRQAVRLEPAFWQARFELGGQLGLAGRIPEAGEQLQEAVRLNPRFPLAHLNLGLALMKLGQPDGARHEFEETLRLEPTNRLAPVCLRQLETHP